MEKPTSTPKDGGPAFPQSVGMSLRDYFAGQFIAGYASLDRPKYSNQTQISMAAYAVADAMLAERNK